MGQTYYLVFVHSEKIETYSFLYITKLHVIILKYIEGEVNVYTI